MSRRRWVTSDQHFYHNNVMEFEETRAKLGQSPDDHWMFLAREWNKKVSPGDIVYQLGDFVWKRDGVRIIRRLNGRIRVILGNHDYFAAEYLKSGVDKIFGVKYLSNGVVLSHCPLCLDNHWKLNIHGHLHSRGHRDAQGLTERHVNVCVENTNFAPVDLDELIKDYSWALRDDPFANGGFPL